MDEQTARNIEKTREGLLSWVRGTLKVDMDVPMSQFAGSDWELVVKLHAMIETALNAAITARIGEPSLWVTIANLDTSNSRCGKIAFAEKLGILSHEHFILINKLSELRNLCVHDIRNFNFDLAVYLFEATTNKRNEFLKALSNALIPGVVEVLEKQFGRNLFIGEKLINSVSIIITLLAFHCRAWEIRYKDHEWPPTPVEF